ncbi:CBO0543 family protein [Bacillus benzoevorans]|uniref:Uncharacterized protein n=1 Tax=Bacillus benzoevorans TaxID=1456 RepID=A0A7X0HUV8_9BACI|nr:CBO0543 family protein [Bacillus benzoevorans]MBB6447226.1 hypothetical protein [Bacillus benzoevorans]
MYIFINLLFLIAGCKWGDWRNWHQYYPTILFLIIGDLLYDFLLYNKSMWLFHDLILPNHTTITLLSMAVTYSATVLIYLGRFPEGWRKRSLWFLLWLGIFSLAEFINHEFGFITYHNGWNFSWSILFTVIIFLLLPIHYKKPLAAWVLSLIIILSLLSIFNVNLDDMK